ncbi:MAG: hypothetical protein UHH95_01560 [Oscillospiraceae bacterium]|nr:hypothetical protein [Oscillospiraceae bacterium]
MFYKVKEIIDEWDPINLLAMHCPDDEYNDISFSISQKVRTIVNVEDLANYIYDLFGHEFGITTFEKTLDDCRIIARKIAKTAIGGRFSD